MAPNCGEMNFRHHFERLAVRMSPQENRLLRVFYLDGPITLHCLSERADSPPNPDLSSCLRTLVNQNLIETSQGNWGLSWNGYGVVSWQLQKEAANGSKVIPLPRPGENGYHRGPACRKYRETLFRPGFCWCCRRRFDHFDQVLASARAIILGDRPQTF